MSLAFLVLVALAQGAEWPTYHGAYSLEGVAATAPPDAPVRLWKFKAGNRVEFTPVSAGGRVFFTTSKGALFAVDLKGVELWKIEIGKDTFSSPPIHADGAVIAGTTNGHLKAFDAATGKERWTYDVGGNVQGSANRLDLPGGKKAIVVISQGDGCIHAVDPDAGKLLWKTEAVERCDGSPGVGGGRIVMGSCASALHVTTVDKEPVKTDVPLGGDSQIAHGVAISGKTAFAGTRGGKVVAIDLAASKVLWTNADTQREAFTTPAVDDRWVVFGSDDGSVYGLSRETGVKAWGFDTGRKPSSPVIAGKRVIVASAGRLFLLDLESGKQVWTEEVSDEITSPAVVDGVILVGADDGTVTAYGRK